MIPTPDITIEWIVGSIGLITMLVGGGISLWHVEKDYSSLGMIFGFIVGFGLLLVALNSAYGLGDYTDGKFDYWRDTVTIEYTNTECPYLEDLSNQYGKSNIDSYTVKEIQGEIESHYIYKCLETNDYVFNGERRAWN